MAERTPASYSDNRLRPMASPMVLDRYELIAPLGSGGMASVYLGRVLDAGAERFVAVKVCHAHLRSDLKFVKMFLKEASVASRLLHPHVVPTLDVGDGEELYLVMEYVEGGSLRDLIVEWARRGQRLPVAVILRIIRDALAGLHHAHELRDAEGRPLNLVHRDVSPQNLLVGADGATRVADFGVAKVEGQTVLTRTDELKGKVAYMAPEQLRGQVLTRRADLFSTAIVLWESLTGERLFKGANDYQSMTNVLSGPIRSPSSLRAEVPRELDRVVRQGLERLPERRYETAVAFLEAIKGAGVELATPSEVGALVEDALSEQLAASLALRHARRAPPAPLFGDSTTPLDRRDLSGDSTTPLDRRDLSGDSTTPLDRRDLSGDSTTPLVAGALGGLDDPSRGSTTAGVDEETMTSAWATPGLPRRSRLLLVLGLVASASVVVWLLAAGPFTSQPRGRDDEARGQILSTPSPDAAPVDEAIAGDGAVEAAVDASPADDDAESGEQGERRPARPGRHKRSPVRRPQEGEFRPQAI